MNLYDQHLHSRHSCDSNADPAENVRRAIDVGLAGLTFTEHYDTHPDERPTCRYDDAAYSDTIESLRAQFGGRIRIGKGVEVCYQPDRMPEIVEFLDRHVFDLVLLSVHWCFGVAIHKQEVWMGRDPSAVTRRYLEAVLDAVRFCERLHARRPRVFDVLAHLDFCKRYSFRFAQRICLHEHADLLDEILRTCLAADLVPEINTSTVRQGIGEAMPGLLTVRRYAELGGTMMSLGSDSHRSPDIGAGFSEQVANLRAAGLMHTAVFFGRVRHPEPLPPTSAGSVVGE